jgi:Mrp family chromosome partitioning ATPase
VLVVRAGRTSRVSLRRACALLEHSGCVMLGAVINAVDTQHMHPSYYGYGYDYRPNAT